MDRNPPVNILLGAKETIDLIDDLEQRLRGQIDKMERLKLCVAEALVSNVSSTGFSYLEQNSVDLKMSLAEHFNSLCDLNERVKSLEMGTTLLAQACTKPRIAGSRRVLRRSNTPSPFCEDAQSELGWGPVWLRRNSCTASEMSCAW